MEDEGNILLDRITDVIYHNRHALAYASNARVKEICKGVAKSVMSIYSHGHNKKNIKEVQHYQAEKIKNVGHIIQEYFGESYDSLKVKELGRKSDKKWARHVTLYLLRVTVGLSLSGAGILVLRDHATVLNSVKRVNDRMDTEKDFKKFINHLTKSV